MFLLKSKLFDGLNGQQHSRPPSLTNLHLICLNKFNVFVWRRLLNSFHLYSIHGNQSNIRLSTPLDGFTCCTRNHAAASVTCRIPFSKNKWINEFVKIQVNYGKFLFDSELIFKNWVLPCDIHLKIDLVSCFCLRHCRQNLIKWRRDCPCLIISSISSGWSGMRAIRSPTLCLAAGASSHHLPLDCLVQGFSLTIRQTWGQWPSATGTKQHEPITISRTIITIF